MKKMYQNLISLSFTGGGGKRLSISALTMFALFHAHAQYSCVTATPIIVKDSLELDSFSHSGFDDRWFTFSLTDSVSYIGFQWEWASKNANVPYDSLIIYTDSFNQLRGVL